MIYPSSLPSPLIEGFSISLPHAVLYTRTISSVKRRPTPSPLASGKVTFFLSKEQLDEWNNLFYNDLESGTKELEINWQLFKKIKFVGKPTIETVGQLYYKLSISIISIISVKDTITTPLKTTYCNLIECMTNTIKGE